MPAFDWHQNPRKVRDLSWSALAPDTGFDVAAFQAFDEPPASPTTNLRSDQAAHDRLRNANEHATIPADTRPRGGRK